MVGQLGVHPERRRYCKLCRASFIAKLDALDKAAIRPGTTTRIGGGTGSSALAVEVTNRPQSIVGRPQTSSIQGILKTTTVAADGEQATKPKEMSNAELQRKLTRLEKKVAKKDAVIESLQSLQVEMIGAIGKGKSRKQEIGRCKKIAEARKRLKLDGEKRDVLHDLALVIDAGRLKAKSCLMDYISDTAKNALYEKTTSWRFRDTVFDICTLRTMNAQRL